MDVLSSGGNRTPSSSRKIRERRVDDSPEVEQDVDSEEDAVVVTSRRATKSKQRPSSSQTNAVNGENDENADPALDATPASSNSVHGKRRRLSESGRAAAVATPTQDRQHEEADEEEEDDDTPPPPDVSGSGLAPRGSQAQDEDEEEEDDDELDPLMAEAAEEAKERKKPLMKKQLLVRDKNDGYVMGSIVRIKCHNFLTYFDIECRPGPHLNMIFGPNGSGKSSLVAAMALGLGFPPKVMARSKKLSEYVKRGTAEGYCEVELKGRPGKRNLTVRRSFQAQNDRSEFKINGKVAPKNEVAECVRALNVNVNNLCSFLPQDRVSDFAKMSGEELLKETQRTADEELLGFQNDLTELKNKLSKADKDLAKHKEELVEQERKMNGLERDVRRHKERQALEDRLLVEEVCLPYVQYQEAKFAHEAAKRERNELKGRMDELADDNAPLMEQKDALKAHIKDADKRRKDLSKKRDEIMRVYRSTGESVANLESKVNELREELKQVKDAEEKRKRKIEESQRKIKDLKKERENGPPQEASLEVGDRSRELREQLSALKAQIYELAAQHDTLSKSIDAAHAEKTRFQQQLQALSNVQRQREDLCRNEDNGLWTAFDWVRRNRNNFKGIVYDPIRLCVSVKDRRHARVAEAAINYGAMKTILCLERDDYRRLGDTFTKFKGSDHPDAQVRDLRVNVAEFPPDSRDLAKYERPCTQQQLQSLGFDAFVIDLLEGPPEILAYLCYSANLHRVPVAFGDGKDVAHERLRQPNSPFKRYITHNTITDIQFSRYGNRSAIVQDQQTRDPKLFAESIDQDRKRELELKVAEADAAKEEAQAQRDILAKKDGDLRLEIDNVVEERAQVDKERQRIERAKLAYEKLGVDLRNAEAALASLQQQPSAEATRRQLADKIKKLSLKRVRTNRSLEGYSAALVACHALEAQPMLAQLQSSASLQAVETTIATRNDEQAGVVRNFQTVSKRVNDLRAVAKRIFEQAEEGQTRVTDRLAEAFQTRIDELTNETADRVNEIVQDLKGELELSQHVNRGVIDKYESLKKSVEKLQRDISNMEHGVRGSKEKIDRIHAKWEPRVKRIVETVGEKFSAAMQTLGCLGEVAIKEDEDYSKWAISIKVAFRDGEALAELTSHRQSGGERSLTTMMYLISLLEMSKVPFSLVDEINQGMDARAERAVHNHLVRAVCEAPDVGQYFLLTPKLLTNLYYHANIKILCVNNGEWLPEDGLPVRELIDKKMAAKRQAMRV